MLTTDRLEILPWASHMAQDFFDLSRDDGFGLFPITIYQQENLESARAWIEEMAELHRARGLSKWAVFEKQTHSLIGMGGLTPWVWEEIELIDVTYRFRQSAWGKGLGFELAKALVDYGFDQKGLLEITATITPDNIASKKIAEKLGMKLDKRIKLKGVPTDLYRMMR